MTANPTGNSTANPWTLVKPGEPFTCSYFTVRSDLVSMSGGAPRLYNSIRMKLRGVAVLPIDAEGCTTLVGQYRYVLDRYSWELPGGGSPPERPALETAKDELAEETGYRAEHWLQVLEAPVAPGTLDEITTGFVAWGLTAGDAHPEADEQLALRRVPFAEAIAMALQGEIGHVSSVAALFSLQTRLMRGELPESLERLLR
jgi:8-oxo-dGTP pyrophosphatase MutT (NUDIX family)